MSYLHALILGIIQGLSEFLPISSSGHLIIVPYLFGWDYQGLDFDVALHFGTFLAIIIYFWRDWILIISRAIKIDEKTKDDVVIDLPDNLFWVILVSSIPAATIGYFFDSTIEKSFRSPLLVATLLIIFALILLSADKFSKNLTKIKAIGYRKGMIIGAAQAISLIPGVSRSGITTSAGLFLNLSRKDATRFSFLLATPAIFGAFLFTLKDYSVSTLSPEFFLAVVTSATTGFLAIKYLLAYLGKHSFLPFVIYRLVIAAIVAIVYFIR